MKEPRHRPQQSAEKIAAAPGRIYTIGHSTRSSEDFVLLLKEHGVTLLVDVRTIPRSRHNPQFNSDVLPRALAPADIRYLHVAGLGGLRRPRPDSPNTGWRNPSFQGFADYMRTEEFKRNLEELLDLARTDTIALMCAEVVPWRCHRSLIADALTVRGTTVVEILGPSSIRNHHLTPWAKVDGSLLAYPEDRVLGAQTLGHETINPFSTPRKHGQREKSGSSRQSDAGIITTHHA